MKIALKDYYDIMILRRMTMNSSKYGITPAKEKALAARMNDLDIKESDISERFIRAGGKGGQKVNKTAVCVYLKHLPTGIEVRCQKERSQLLNRFFARRLLTSKIEAKVLGKKSQEQKRIYKLQKQKRKRSKRAKEKILKEKHIQSEKKEFRRSQPNSEEN